LNRSATCRPPRQKPLTTRSLKSSQWPRSTQIKLPPGNPARFSFPEFDIDLYTAADDKLLGGQLASWDEDGYPIEHGLHSLFDFYDSILPLLKRAGALGSLTRAPKHIFIFDRGAIRKFHPRTFFLTYRGFTASEKWALRRLVPIAARIISDIRLGGYTALDKYDALDLREYGRLVGLPESILQSRFVQQFYDAGFNEPYHLSAAVGINSIYRIFKRPGLLFFNHSSRDTIISPLLAYFERLGGRVHIRHRLTNVHLAAAGDRISHLVFENSETGDVLTEAGDSFILALGLEDFKSVRLGGLEELQYFKQIHSLKTVSSLSIQAWFKEDPVPANIDTIVNGLPLPFSILGPMTRVRGRPANGPLPFEIMATGPEAGYEGWSDADLKEKFFQDLRALGFSISDDAAEHHVVIRRNDAPFHRYLLTVPGQLVLRPTVQSPVPNLFLAGAWVRNSFSLPCVDAATESGLKAAQLISDTVTRKRDPIKVDSRRAMPRTHSLVLPPPYRFKNVVASTFLLPSHSKRIQAELPPGLTLLRGFESQFLLSLFHHGHVCADHDTTGAVYSYNECVISAVVCESSVSLISGLKPRFGIFPLAVYLDNDVATAAGREVYGFPKKLAAVHLDVEAVQVVRSGLLPGDFGATVGKLSLLNGNWRISAERRSPSQSGLSFLMTALDFISKLPKNEVADNLFSIPVYNILGLVGASATSVTRLPVTDLRIGKSWPIVDAKFIFGESATDPISEYYAGRDETHEGLGLNLEFSLKEAGRV
jgi:15-cis-phytoene desaturase